MCVRAHIYICISEGGTPTWDQYEIQILRTSWVTLGSDKAATQRRTNRSCLEENVRENKEQICIRISYISLIMNREKNLCEMVIKHTCLVKRSGICPQAAWSYSPLQWHTEQYENKALAQNYTCLIDNRSTQLIDSPICNLKNSCEILNFQTKG